MYLFMNYTLILFKLFLVIFEPDKHEFFSRITNKNYDISTKLDNEFQYLKTNMKENCVFLLKILWTLDLQNLLFCIVIKRTAITILYFQILFIVRI